MKFRREYHKKYPDKGKKIGKNPIKKKVMKVIIKLVFVLFLFSCKTNSVFFMSKKNQKTTNYYKEKVLLQNYIDKDTLLIEKNVYCIIKSPVEFEVGELKNNLRRGKWFFYNDEEDEIKCYMIKKYSHNKSENIFANGIYNTRSW